jgi:hypothetical protein
MAVEGYESRVEVYSYYPRKLHGTISRATLRAMGLAASPMTTRISATTRQLQIYKAQETWKDADE